MTTSLFPFENTLIQNTNIESAESAGLDFIADYNLNEIEIGGCGGANIGSIAVREFMVWGEHKTPHDLIQNRFRTYLTQHKGLLAYFKLDDVSTTDLAEIIQGNTISSSPAVNLDFQFLTCPSYMRTSTTYSCRYSPLLLIQNDDFQIDAPDIALSSQFSIEYAFKIEGAHATDVVIELSNATNAIFKIIIQTNNAIRTQLFDEDGIVYLDKTTALTSPILTLTQFSLTHSDGNTAFFLNGVEEDSDSGVIGSII